MATNSLLDILDYNRSPSFLGAADPAMLHAPAYGHVFRRATAEPGLVGVYTLRASKATPNTPAIPAVYVCRSGSDAEADRIHRLVWNQDVVPFVIVEHPRGFRLYSGFEYDPRPEHQAKNLLRSFNTATELAAAGFHADAIDDGTLWRRWGRDVRPESRVDWRLLANLKTLDRWLQKHGLKPDVSHALIGKYVYLYYLRHRKILSDRKLEGWAIFESTVFGRDATAKGLKEVTSRLDEWLNGGVFPIMFGTPDAPNDDHVSHVAATFAGDEPSDGDDWQLHLDFQAYDFSYIPIETLSVVYEQFLHAPSGDSRSRGKEAGAYYTPIPVVNFMLAEMEDRKPLKRGTRVLDPSCGSGAFLVQCYRRLIEKEGPTRDEQPRPVQLREILQRSIFGVDRDGDACSVAELSLILTLLDYCDPPDLDGTQFKLPSLRNANIFAENFFRRDPDCISLLGRRKFDWIIGNPPWKRLNPHRLASDDVLVWEWMQGQEKRGTPVGDNEVAQAFAWDVARYMARDSVAGLLMPATTLSKDWCSQFRSSFFGQFHVHSIANFSNLTEVLFAGRSRDPAAAFFYSLREQANDQHTVAPGVREMIIVYSPMVANQEVTRPVVENKRNETWSLTLNASEVRAVRLADAVKGNALPWKIATWGSHLDMRLLEKLSASFDSLGALEESGLLTVSRGPELFAGGADEPSYDVVKCDEAIGKKLLDVNPLKKLRHIFAFPPAAVTDNDKVYLRSRGGSRGLLVCRPPHIIVSAARNFAVFTDEYLLVPSGQFGIASPTRDARFLKALTLFLNSDFAFYHQFLVASHLGVKRPRVHLIAMRELPMPLPRLSTERLNEWAMLHDRLAAASRKALVETVGDRTLFGEVESDESAVPLAPPKVELLLEELNGAVYEALGLKLRERALVEDLVHIRLQLDDGKLGKSAVAPPTTAQLKRYGKRLKSELDSFVGDELPKRYDVNVIHDGYTGMVQLTFVKADEPNTVAVYAADDETASELERTRQRLRRKHAQWVYFDRNLQIFDGRRTYFFKPMQRFHWTESQAMSDAAEVISRTLAKRGGTVD